MQIPLESIHERQDPYQLFLDSLKSDETKRKYKNHLLRFLKLVPSKFYEDNLRYVPNCQEVGTLAKCFVELARKKPDLVKNVIAAFIKEEKKLVEQGKLNPNTLPNHVKPIRALLDANGIALHWKSLTNLFPRERTTEDRAYTREELQRMIEASSDITDKLIVQIFSSAGFRLEAWDYLTWKDIILFRNSDCTYKGAALLVYRGDPESYWTFVTPEACKTLDCYRELWKSQIGKFPSLDDPLIKATKIPVVTRLDSLGIKRRLDRLVRKIGLRCSLPPGKKRYDIPLAHGFRKYFNTMMRRAKVNYLDKEDMMGHAVGLERHYERYNEEDFERFPEYQKAIPFLTISDDERLRLKNQKLENENSELEKKTMKITALEETLAKVMHKLELLEKTNEEGNSCF